VNDCARTAIMEDLFIPVIGAVDDATHDGPSPGLPVIIVAFGDLVYYFAPSLTALRTRL